MSYTVRDMISDKYPEVHDLLKGADYPDKLDELIRDVYEYAYRSAVRAIDDASGDWASVHEYRYADSEPLPDYVRGVSAGMRQAAREIEGL